MGIFSNVKAKVRLSKLKDRVDKDPSPVAVKELAQFYIHNGDNDAAYALLEKSLGEFPDSEVLRGIWNYVRKSKVSDQIRGLVDSLAEEPLPETFESIIQVYREQKDIGSAEEYTHRFLKEFPDQASAHRIMAEIRLNRFGEDFSAKDGKAAEFSLKRALDLESEDQEARFLMARLYYCCGLKGRSQTLVDQILEADPEHEYGQKLKALLEGAEDCDEDPDFRFSKIEDQRKFFYNWECADSEEEPEEPEPELSSEDCAAMAEHLNKALDIEGTNAATLIGRNGEFWGTGSSGSDAGWEPFCEYVERVRDAARTTSLRMDIGAFEKGIIEGDGGGIIIRELRDGTVAFLLDDRQNLSRDYPALRDLVEEMMAIGGKNDEKNVEGAE